MKQLAFLTILLLGAYFSKGQNRSNPNYQPQPTATDAQRRVAQPGNTNPSPQREVITPRTDAITQPAQLQAPQPVNNASYQDNSKFYNKDNMPVNSETNKIPSGNGDYQQPGYSNPINKPSTQ